MEKISVVVPCYNEEDVVYIFHAELLKTIKQMDVSYEIIFINDGSKDKTLNKLEDMHKLDTNVVVLDFSRNFGKEAGILAGLEAATGDYVCIMDVDLQDPPSLLPEMLDSIKNEGFDCVASRRVSRKGEPLIRSFFARNFYKLINKYSDVKIVDGARDFRLMTKQMVASILELREYHRFSKGIFEWVGYNTKYLEFENVERVAGETSWSFWGLFKYAIEGIVGFTTAPLRVATYSGIFVSIASFIYMIFVFGKALLYGDPVAGYPSMMVVILFLGGIQLLSLGIIGEYLAKTYMESKRRPSYFIKKTYRN